MGLSVNQSYFGGKLCIYKGQNRPSCPFSPTHTNKPNQTRTHPAAAMNDIPAPIPSTYKIRPATEHDMPQINGIVNHEIAVSVNNFNYGPRSEQDGLAWFRATIAGGYPIFVATSTVEGGAEEVVAGYSSLGSFRQKDGYRFTAEYSLYIHHEHRQRGLGKRLLKDLLIEAKLRNFHAIIGSISEGNEASVHLAKSFGFRVVGTMKDNGFKFNRWVNNIFLELLI